ncbi:hypothetical protein MAP00_006570 [Monascus purpureus]|nr:hypothetical protein MAP00_006570 [Monascus purpureus]
MAPMKNVFEGRRVLQERARRGERLSDDEIGSMTQQTASLAGVPDGSRANMNPDQICWAAKADEILGKPADQINSDDGRALQARENKAFESLPATGSAASHVQSVGEKNER